MLDKLLSQVDLAIRMETGLFFLINSYELILPDRRATMTSLIQQYRVWARRVLGKKLISVKGIIYIFETPDLEHPQLLQFNFFHANNATSFRCGKDGSSLELTDSPLQETDLGEYGKELIMD